MLVIEPHDGRDVPVVRCDHCREPITDARDGNYQWWMPRGGRHPWTEMYFTHKGCCRAFEATHVPTQEGYWGAMGLELLPIYLGNVLGLDWREARERAVLMSSL